MGPEEQQSFGESNNRMVPKSVDPSIQQNLSIVYRNWEAKKDLEKPYVPHYHKEHDDCVPGSENHLFVDNNMNV